jgi:hypothetical protein
MPLAERAGNRVLVPCAGSAPGDEWGAGCSEVRRFPASTPAGAFRSRSLFPSFLMTPLSIEDGDVMFSLLLTSSLVDDAQVAAVAPSHTMMDTFLVRCRPAESFSEVRPGGAPAARNTDGTMWNFMVPPAAMMMSGFSWRVTKFSFDRERRVVAELWTIDRAFSSWTLLRSLHNYSIFLQIGFFLHFFLVRFESGNGELSNDLMVTIADSALSKSMGGALFLGMIATDQI